MTAALFLVFIFGAYVAVGSAHLTHRPHSMISDLKLMIRSQELTLTRPISTRLNMSKENKRKVVRYDNVGDPIYEDELDASSGGISVFGIKTNLDAPTVSLLIFGLIAFNFFVLANL